MSMFLNPRDQTIQQSKPKKAVNKVTWGNGEVSLRAIRYGQRGDSCSDIK